MGRKTSFSLWFSSRERNEYLVVLMEGSCSYKDNYNSDNSNNSDNDKDHISDNDNNNNIQVT